MTETETPRRVRARRGEGERLREDILAAAERLLMQTGDAAAVSIRAVAKDVGVTPPSIYLHFADKTELLFAVCQVRWRHFDECLRAATEGVDDPIEKLRGCARAYIEFGLADPEHYRILFMGKQQDLPAGVEMGDVLLECGFARLAQHIGEAVEQGRLAGDPQMIVFEAWAMVHGLTSLLIAHPDMPWPDRHALAEHQIATFLRGLAP